MLKIDILAVGKTKESWLANGEKEFTKRLHGSVSLKIHWVRDESVKNWRSAESIKGVEGERIIKLIRKDSFVAALDLRGKEFSSEEFAGEIKKLNDRGKPLTFIIGGALGLSEEVIKRADLTLSLSKLTFTHQMVRVFLLEQIFRALSINSGKEYHR